MNARNILDAIRKGKLSFPPIQFSDVRVGRNGSPDAWIRARWNEKEWEFAVEIKARSTPKILRDALQSVRMVASPPVSYPLIVVPFLTEDQVEELATQNVSGVDLSGNGVLAVPGQLLVMRTAKPNRYPEKSVLKNVYRGKASLAARVFLLRSRYDAVGQIRDEIRARGGDIALSTVSKVLARLEEDLIVSRDGGSIRLVQPRKLLAALVKQYRPPSIENRVSGRTPSDIDDYATRLEEAANRLGLGLAPTGASSTSSYAIMAREEPAAFYCTDVEILNADATLATLFQETERFPNVRIEETRDDTVYFDVRRTSGRMAASPIQTYLELATGDKRDREAADQVANEILKGGA